MGGRQSRTFKKTQKEQRRKEKREAKLARKLDRKQQGPAAFAADEGSVPGAENEPRVRTE